MELNMTGADVADFEREVSLLKAMAHPVRLRILDMLRRGETCVCHIEAALDLRQAYVSQQLMVLREAGLVASRKDGLQVYYSLDDETVRAVLLQLIGPVDDRGWIRYEGCRCPNCATIPLAEIR